MWNHLVQPSWSGRVSYCWLSSTVCSSISNIWNNGDSMTSLGSLCQCLTILTVKKCFLFSEGPSCVYFVPTAFCPDHWGITERSWAPSSSFPHIWYLCRLIRFSLSHLFSRQSSPSSNPLLTWVTRSWMNMLKSNGPRISLSGASWLSSSWTLYHWAHLFSCYLILIILIHYN